MPNIKFFTNEEAYYSTLFHELSHASGHISRLARKSLMENKGMSATGDTAHKTYAEEELVAEMAASFLNARAGIIEDEIENSAAYLQSWINALRTKDAQSWIVRAASQGQKAADFILGRHLIVAPDTIATEPNAAPSGSFVEKVTARATSNPAEKIRS